MNKIISSEMDHMNMNEHIWQIREDLPGDVLLSAKLVKAALEENWNEVEMLLELGADPRICRFGNSNGSESALYYTLKAKRFDLADKLYKAGDRLDDLVLENEESLPSCVLEFLSYAMRCGDNYFYDESKTLSECCRCSAFEQIEKLMPLASSQELSKAFYNTVFTWIDHFKSTNLYSKILEDLLAYGATLSYNDKTAIFEAFERRFNNCPQIMHPGVEELSRIVELVKKA